MLSIRTYFLLVFATIIVPTWTYNSYMIVCPEAIRPGMQFQCRVDLLRRFPALKGSMEVTAGDFTISTTFRIRRSENGKLISLDVPAILPMTSSYEVSITAADLGGNVHFKNTTTLTMKDKSMSVFIQTDKAIYKPGQTVQFRCFAVGPDLKTVNGSNYKMDIDIFDPMGNKIAQWMDVSGPMGVFQGQLKLSDQPPLGDWSMDVTAMVFQYYQYFDLLIYLLISISLVFMERLRKKKLLPKFEVSVSLPPFLVMGDDLTGKVSAKYTFGKGLVGTGTLFIKKKNMYMYPMLFEEEGSGPYSIEFDIDDSFSFRINGKELFTQLGIGYATTLEVRAEVTETLTGKMLSDTADVEFFNRAEKLVFLDGSDNFKPGLKYAGYVFLSDQNNKPLGGEDKVVNVTVTLRSDTIKELEGLNIDPFLVAVAKNGMAKIAFKVPLGVTQVSIKHHVPQPMIIQIPVITHIGRTFSAEYDKGLSKMKYLQPFKSTSNTYIQVALSPLTRSPKAGRNATFVIKSTKGRADCTYLIIARGKIVSHGPVSVRKRRAVLEIMMTSSMTPTSRIVVYYVKKDAEIVTDSISFNVEGIFENRVDVGFSKRSSKPGQAVSLEVDAEPGSMCSVLTVDKSVLLLKSGNDITQDMVEEELSMYDSIPQYPCSPFGPCLRMFFPVPNPGTDAASIFQKSGLVVMTDAFLYKEEPNWPIWRKGGEEPMYPEYEVMAMAMEDNSAPVPSSGPRVRKLFPETWLFSNDFANDEGKCIFNTIVPDTITTWVATAFAVHNQVGLGVASKAANLRTFLNFFIRLELPYSVVRGEQVVLRVTLFNFYNTAMKVRVSIKRSEQYQHILVRRDDEGHTKLIFRKRDIDRVVKVPADSGVTVNFPIRPLELGDIDITVQATSGRAGDAVSRPLLVKPEGIPESYNLPILVDIKPWREFKVEQNITFPDNVVPGSERIRISAIGDLMGPTVNGLTDLLRMPYGCGEQNMINFAPNVYVINYLDAISNLKPEDLSKGQGFMMSGYQRELTYQHFDGSFSAFGNSDPSGSTWLTAFVVKSFAQAKPYIFIDKSLMTKAIQWLINRYDDGLGIFDEPGRVIHTEMQGGSASGEGSLTAYTLIALLESKNNGFGGADQTALDATIDGARAALENAIMGEPTTYEASIISYALSLSDSDKADSALVLLETKATLKDGMMYWDVTDSLDESNLRWKPPYVQAQSRSIEVTSYALLAYAAKGDVTSGLKIIKWLVKQRNTNGGFGSTQDTVIALQALSKFAALVYSPDFNLLIRVLVDPMGFGQVFQINGNNALLYQNKNVPNPGDVTLATVTAEGNGTALVEIAVMYNVKEEPVAPQFGITVAISGETITRFELNICFRWLSKGKSSMAVMEIEMLSGFNADKFSVTDLGILQRVDEQDTKLVLYFDEITPTEECLSVTMERQQLVAGSQPATVTLYDYYQPEKRASSFYQPKKLSNTNVCDIGGC